MSVGGTDIREEKDFEQGYHVLVPDLRSRRTRHRMHIMERSRSFWRIRVYK